MSKLGDFGACWALRGQVPAARGAQLFGNPRAAEPEQRTLAEIRALSGDPRSLPRSPLRTSGRPPGMLSGHTNRARTPGTHFVHAPQELSPPTEQSVEAPNPTHTRPRIAVPCRSRMAAILTGTQVSQPLAHLTGRPSHDTRWPGLPIAVYSQAAVEDLAESSSAQRAAAQLSEAEWRRGGGGDVSAWSNARCSHVGSKQRCFNARPGCCANRWIPTLRQWMLRKSSACAASLRDCWRRGLSPPLASS